VGRTVLVVVIVILATAATGPLLGWLWAEVAPRVPVLRVEGGFVYATAEPEEAVAADGWFTLLAAGAGLLLAPAVWFAARRHRGWVLAAALVVGCLVASVLAWWVGHTIGQHEFDAVRDVAVGQRVDAPLGLRVTHLDADRWWLPRPTGVAAVQALVAVFVYTCLAGLSNEPDLRAPAPRTWSDPTLAYPPPYPPPVPYGPTAAVTAGPPAPPPGPPAPYEPPPANDGATSGGQFTPGRADSSDQAAGTART
jgi:hypothetical protein